MDKLLICPSILAADFRNLAAELGRVANADYIHVDVMDGHYVPNLTFGPMVARAVQDVADIPLDVHLMVTNPDECLELFVPLRPGFLTVHYEACTHLQRTLARIREAGIKAGVALNPHTPLAGLEYVLDDLDLILVMTVNPGYGGQEFIPSMEQKIAAARRLIGSRRIRLQVDGGISLDNLNRVVSLGADTIVAGSAVFQAADPMAYIDKMRAIG
ncbi:MAG TPA: ribulose-phosphate 3-epimerase [Limnochordia bacterium]|nr:ribulose-phosphate 3-epimerase [Bacillota bacterium]HKM17302.1 ribulose-phosphate 3-epimerase [Limnochordia bacterium]